MLAPISFKKPMKNIADDRKLTVEKAIGSFEQLFRVICLLCAVSMCLYCVFDYLKDEDLSEVTFTKFKGNNKNTYPQVSLCFNGQFSDVELKNINPNFSAVGYAEHIKGLSWDSRMADLDYEKIVTKPDQHLLHTCAKSSYGGICDVKSYTSTHVYFWGVSCLTLHATPTNRMFEASLWMNSSVFTNGKRPPLDYKFVVSLSYPKQILKFAYHFGTWPERNSSDSFSMNFRIKDVEVLRRRFKSGSKCSDWQNYDTIVEEKALSYVGCRLFKPHSESHHYSPLLDKYPACDSIQKTRLIKRLVYDDIISDSGNLIKFTPPCSEIKRMNVERAEEITSVEREEFWVPSTRGKLPTNGGWFRVRVKFIANEFKEFKQVRAYNAENLIGNSGGYIGLLVGYTIAQMPRMVTFFIMKKCF